MAENIFKDLLPEEDLEKKSNVGNEFNDLLPQGEVTLSNQFNDLLPAEERDVPIKNEFKLSDTPDDKYELKEKGLFDDLLPED